MSTSSKGCIATNNEGSYHFDSRTEAANWLIYNGLTSFKKNTVTKKIATAIREQIEFCGYKWSATEGKTQEELQRNYNINQMLDNEEDYGTERTALAEQNIEDWEESLSKINSQIRKARAISYDNSMGIKSALYKNLPQLKTKEDLMKEFGCSIPYFNIYALSDCGLIGFNDLGELAVYFKINLSAKDIDNIITNHILREYIQIIISDEYIETIKRYYDRFDKI